MSLEGTVYRSPLDKPLHHLTQDDISQLTRFHFPRYLKAKGMRRPSWNKSQAMQQFISLKKLRLILYIPRLPCNSTSTACATNGPEGQMTIFCCGKVNVYDDAPAEKLAASPLQLPLEVPFEGTTARRPLLCHLQAATVKVGPDALVVILPTSQAVNMTGNCQLQREESAIFHEDNPGSRKASVQRYLEKRKDRCKSKRKVATSTSASMDIYLNHQIGKLAQNERSNRSDACSSPQIRPPTTPTRCGSVENNIVKHADV